MKTINLIYPEKSDVKFEQTVFPDGEPHIKLSDIDRKDSYTVICRITNPNELFILMQVADVLDRQEVVWNLTIYYLMSQRMDRVISFNESFSLKVVADILNNMNYSYVYIYQPHSDRSIQLIKNAHNITDRSKYMNLRNSLFEDADNLCVVYPDKGAAERYSYSIWEHAALYKIVLNKVRDLENKGKILNIKIAEDTVTKGKCNEFVFIDDLCDAGGTFMWGAEVIRKKYPDAKLYIMVQHAVNRIGIDNLAKTFDKVIITNSYKDWNNLPDNVRMLDVINA